MLKPMFARRGWGALEQTNQLWNRHHWRIWTAGRPTESQEEAAVRI